MKTAGLTDKEKKEIDEERGLGFTVSIIGLMISVFVISFLFGSDQGSKSGFEKGFKKGFKKGTEHGKKVTQELGVDAGAGEYYFDKKHQKQFRWLKNKKGE